MHRVSIIISNYNYGRFVGDAIESALGQTHPDCELIVVDDGSTDDSREILQRYSVPKVLLQENGGQAAAFNAGFHRCSGDVVIFLDADDTLEPRIAEVVSRVMASDSNVAKVMYRLQIIDEEGTPTGEIKPSSHLPTRSGDLRSHVLRFPYDMTWMATSGNAFRTTSVAKIFPMPEEDYPICADYYLSHLTPLFGSVVFLGEIGGSYRVHPDNSYERSVGELDLDQVRKTITYSSRTTQHLLQVANRENILGRVIDEHEVLSVAELWQRQVSLRLDPDGHPFPKDTRTKLLALGLRAAARRSDVSVLLKGSLAAWIILVAVMPPRALPALIRAFESSRQAGLIRELLRRLHR